MVRDDREPPSRSKDRERRVERGRKLFKFLVAGDAERLERPRRDVTTATRGRGHRTLDCRGELRRARRACGEHSTRDGSCIPALPVCGEELRQMVFVDRRKELRCGRPFSRTHPHVEWSLVPIREAPHGGVQLMRGHPEVEKHTDQRSVPRNRRVISSAREHFPEGREPRATHNGVVPEPFERGACCVYCRRIAIESEQKP